MSEALIRRLQERIRSEPTVDFVNVSPPIRPRPPVTEQAVAQAESELGFCLPPLLRALYTRVADRGYGPGHGFLDFAGDEWSLVERAKWTCVAAAAESDPWWPPQLVEVVSWGCHYTSCVDCSRPSCPVIFYDHDCNVEGATRADYLYPEAESLEGWLWAWLDGVDLWAVGPKRRKIAEQGAAADRGR